MESDINEYRKNIKVYIQILSPQNSSMDNVKIDDDRKTILVRYAQELNKIGGKSDDPPNYWKFKTDGILNDMNQEEIFNKRIKPSLR